jgi:lipopolysaccharide transport system permease protein
MRYLKEVFAARELLANLTLREVRGKYKRTVLGQLWSLANPLALMLIYTFVFGIIFRGNHPDRGDPSGLDVFALWLLCALLPWIFFATVLNLASGSLVANASLIQKVYFSRIVLPLSLVGSTAYNWLFEMAVLIVALSVAGSFLTLAPWIPLVLLTMVLLALFAAGLGLMLSIANVYFRDTEYFISILLQMWMYLSPVIYPMSMVSNQSAKWGGLFGTSLTLEQLYRLNPMVHYFEIFRNLLYDNRWPNPMQWLICAAWSFGSLTVGVLVFRANEKRLAEAL